jgi:hypothetical protein
MAPEIIFPLLGIVFVVLALPLANAATGKDMVAFGAVATVIALVLPHVTRLRTETYALVCAGVFGLGSLVLAVRGWRLANRLLRQRRGEGKRAEGYL